MGTEGVECIEVATRESLEEREQPARLWSSQRLAEICEWCLLGLGIYAIVYWLPERTFLDGNQRFQAILNLVRYHTLSATPYSLIGPLFSIPLRYMDRFFSPNAPWWQAKYNVFLLIAVMLITYILLRKRMDASVLRKFFLLLIVASTFGNLITYYGGEVFTALLVGMGLLVALLVSELAGWTAIVLGVATTHAGLLALGLTALGRVLQ